MSNPHLHANLADLARTATTLARELETARVRTPADRAALAESVRLVLLAVARRLAPAPYTPHAPEEAIARRGTSIEAAYGAWYDTGARTLRYEVLMRAADHVLGERAWAWIHSAQFADPADRPGARAIASEAGLAQTLAELGALTAHAAPRKSAAEPAADETAGPPDRS